MTLKRPQLLPLLLCAGFIGLVALLHVAGRHFEPLGLLQRLEWMTYDWRARQALDHPAPAATNLGFVFISNESIEQIANGSLGFQAGLYWPRFVHAWVIEELQAQGAEAVAYDVLFPDQRRDHAAMPDGSPGTPDDNFARALRAAGNVILASDPQALPHEQFRTNAWRLGDISARRDPDGILRRVSAFEDYLLWHPLILRASRGLDHFQFDTNRIRYAPPGRPPVVIPIEAGGLFNQATLYELVSAAEGRPLQFPAGVKPVTRAFSRVRGWDMGIVLAARHLGLDLDAARVEPGRVILPGTNGVERVIPVDDENRFHIDWSLPVGHPGLAQESFHSLLHQHLARRLGRTNELRRLWAGRLAVVGSTASGNDLTDFGATPLDKGTFLTSRHWNVANSILTGRFIQAPPLGAELALLAGLGMLSGLVTWRLRVFFAVLAVGGTAVAYVLAANHYFLASRLWLPVVTPVAALLGTHFALLTGRVIFEQNERRRIRGIFSRIVSPNVVNELLKADRLSLGGSAREVTILFADVRGFTEMTDESHARAQAQIREQGLQGRAAEACFDRQAEEVLTTVNLYLGAIADVVKQHDGTLDKYIGDCVMAFWGAPTPNERHAVACVRAAIDAQRALHTLNLERIAENSRRGRENTARAARGEAPLPLLKVLTMGTGINTGIVSIGLMGSERHISNYTVFGLGVNLAARLETHSGRGRILVGEATYRALLRDDPSLAAACVPQPAAQFKGISHPVAMYEVPWQSGSVTGTTPSVSVS